MTKRRKNYDSRFKKEAVLLSYECGSISKVVEKLKLPVGLLYAWRREYKKYGIDSFPGEEKLGLGAEQTKVYKLENKIKKSDLKFEILKKGGQSVYLGKPYVFQFINDHEKIYSINLMCEVLYVSRASYYRWKNDFISGKRKKKILILEEISSIFLASKQRYGSRRITAKLLNSGYRIGESTVKKYMRELGLRSIVKKTKVLYNVTIK